MYLFRIDFTCRNAISHRLKLSSLALTEPQPDPTLINRCFRKCIENDIRIVASMDKEREKRETNKEVEEGGGGVVGREVLDSANWEIVKSSSSES